MLSLASDPVPNIRFNVSKAIGNLYPNFNSANKAKARQALEKMAQEDSDFDAKFFAGKTLEAMAAQ